jgi:hypothetical protein
MVGKPEATSDLLPPDGEWIRATRDALHMLQSPFPLRGLEQMEHWSKTGLNCSTVAVWMLQFCWWSRAALASR